MDFNGDGYKDLMVGERDGYVNFFERAADKTLKATKRLQANNAAIKVANNSSPFVVDWNDDGLLDLLVGSETEGVLLYLNSGTKTSYKYSTNTKLKTGSTTIKYQRDQIKVIDLNKDGKKDFIVGNGLDQKTHIYYYENIGTNASPSLKAPVALMTKDNKPVYPDMEYDITYDIADWNGDGTFDIVIGDYDGNKIKLFTGNPVVTRVTVSAAKESNYTYRWDAVRGIFSFEYSPKNEQPIMFDLYSAIGKRVFHRGANYSIRGRNLFVFTLDEFSAGVYLMRCTTGDAVRNVRIMIDR